MPAPTLDRNGTAWPSQAEPQVLTEEVLVEVWDGVGFLVLFLVLISAEWCLRKWWGLL